MIAEVEQTEEEVRNMAIPPRTSSYTPVRNGELIDMVRKLAKIYGLELANGQFATTRKGQRMFGSFDVKEQNFLGDMARFKIGLRNSSDKSMSAGICFGSEIMVCSNLVFIGYGGDHNDIVGKVSHKHTTHIHKTLYDRLYFSMADFGIYKEFQEKLFNRLRKTSLTDEEASHTIVNAARQNIIPKKNILDIANVWRFQERGPETEEEKTRYYPDFKGRNAFSLLNAFTEHNKAYSKKNLVEGAERAMNLVGYMYDTFALN